MKRIALFLLLGLVPATILLAAGPRFPLVGRWQTIDPETNTVDGVVEVYKTGNKFYGKLVWTKIENPIDVNGDGKSLLGRVILFDFVHDEDEEYTGGRVYNPRDGKTYRGKIEVQDNGRTLKLRGYVGIPLFGRSQYWRREK
jgi:uncharacterized protein (DUF2147 family)